MAKTTLEVHRPQWRNEELALLCGIANAGGGRLIVGGAEGSRARNVKRTYKTFEAIPHLTQQTFGFACPAEPIMDGPHLCLEIDIPAATEPVSFEGQYYLYTPQGNKRLDGKDLADFFSGRQPGSGDGTDDDSDDRGAGDGDGVAIDGSVVDNSSAACSGAATNDDARNAAADGPDVFEGRTGNGASSTNARQAAGNGARQATGSVESHAQPSGSAGSSNSAKAPKRKASAQASGAKAKTIPSFKSRSIAASKDLYLTNTDEYVLKVLNADGRATAPKIASLLGISESTVRRSFRRLKEYGMIERVGSDKAGYWKVNL